jgi:PAS domain S-box-containing protein
MAVWTKSLLISLSRFPAVRDLDVDACNTLFRETVERNPFYAFIGLANPDGEVLASFPQLGHRARVDDRKYFRDAKTSLDFSAGEFAVGKASTVPTLHFGYPVQDIAGNLAFVLIAGFKVEKYATFMGAIKLPEGSVIELVDHNGKRLFRSPSHPDKSLGTALEEDLFRTVSGKTGQGSFDSRCEDGTLRIYTFKQLRLRAGAPPYLYITAGVPKGPIMSQAALEIMGDLLVLGAVGIIALSTTLVLGNLGIAWPIKKLVAAAQSIGVGNLGARTELAHTPDEFGRLAKSFDDMASLLEERNREREKAEKELSQAYSWMETKVEERTIDLSRSNALLTEEIQARKQAEEERARLVTAIEQVAEGIMITDARGIIQYVNPAYERVTGHQASELIGRHFSVLKKKGDEWLKEVGDSLRRGEAWSGRVCAHKKDGTMFESEMWTSPVRDASGAVTNYISIHRDVTVEARLERELRQAQKMESLGTLAGGIAHDFNNILAAISGYTELAMARVEDSVARRHLDQVLAAGSRAAEMVKRILAFSRRGDSERKPVAMVPLVEEVLMFLRSLLPSTIEIKPQISINSNGGMVFANPTQIHQVLMNLCTNAAHAMNPTGGTLSVKLSETADAPLASGGAPPGAGRYLCLTVSDTGHGMDAETLEKIFDPYFTTKAPGEGTGLGLSVVQGIVKSHGGAVTVASQTGEGTTFCVFLPEIANVAASETGTTEAIPRGGERILFVDDEEALVDLGKSMLEALGYHVTAKTVSLEALKAFGAQPNEFDAVITDMTMPFLTGKDLAVKIIAIRPDIPVVLCTGFSDLIDEARAAEAGIRGFVMKPYNISTLAQAIRKALQ